MVQTQQNYNFARLRSSKPDAIVWQAIWKKKRKKWKRFYEKKRRNQSESVKCNRLQFQLSHDLFLDQYDSDLFFRFPFAMLYNAWAKREEGDDKHLRMPANQTSILISFSPSLSLPFCTMFQSINESFSIYIPLCIPPAPFPIDISLLLYLLCLFISCCICCCIFFLTPVYWVCSLQWIRANSIKIMIKLE